MATQIKGRVCAFVSALLVLVVFSVQNVFAVAMAFDTLSPMASVYAESYVEGDTTEWDSDGATDLEIADIGVFVESFVEDPFDPGNPLGVWAAMDTHARLETDDLAEGDYMTLTSALSFYGDADGPWHDAYNFGQANTEFSGLLIIDSEGILPVGAGGLVLDVFVNFDLFGDCIVNIAEIEFVSFDPLNPIDVTVDGFSSPLNLQIPVLAGQMIEISFVHDCQTGQMPVLWGESALVMDMSLVPEPMTVFLFGFGGLVLLRKSGH